MKQMKAILILALTLPAVAGYSQNESPTYGDRKSIQFSALPGILYNSVAFGVGYKKQTIENVFEANSYYLNPYGSDRFAIGFHYNRNYYLKNDRTYIPVWTGISRVNVNNNFEDGGPYYDKMNLKIGSGIGRVFKINDVHQLRVELGIGAALHFENQSSWDNESPFPFKLALADFTLSENYPVIPALRFKVRYDLRLRK